MYKMKQSAAHILKAVPVIFSIPNDNGSITKTTRHVDFLVLDQSAIDARIESDEPLIKKVVVGWTDFNGEDGKPLEFSESALDELLEMKFAQKALMETYFKAISGEKPKRGN